MCQFLAESVHCKRAWSIINLMIGKFRFLAHCLLSDHLRASCHTSLESIFQIIMSFNSKFFDYKLVAHTGIEKVGFLVLLALLEFSVRNDKKRRAKIA